MDKKKIIKTLKKNIKWNRLLLLFVAAIILVQAYKFCKEKIYLNHSDTIVCVGFSGLKYLFHARYEYYAVGTKSSCKIPYKMIEKQFGDTIKQKMAFVEDEFETWSIRFRYSPDQSGYSEDDYPIETPYGEPYKLIYRFQKALERRVLTLEEQQKIWHITEKLCEGRLLDESTTFDERGEEIIAYQIVRKDEIWYILLSENSAADTLLRISEDGSLVKVLELSEGRISYFYEY